MVTNANPTEWLREQIAMETEESITPVQRQSVDTPNFICGRAGCDGAFSGSARLAVVRHGEVRRGLIGSA